MKFKQKTNKENAKVKTINTPSQFGSHKSMVIEELADGMVLCEDPYGQYKTHVSRLDNGEADPARNASWRF